MATAPEVKVEQDDLLTCSICLETYNAPKYLPCLHTFCESCIKTYIASTTEKEKENTGFNCPVCRAFVSMDTEGKSCEFWAAQLPKNHLIITLLDKRAIDKSEKLCDVCVLSNVKQCAVSWCTVCHEALCSVCENCHRKFKMTAKHKIISVEEIKTDTTANVSPTVMCEDHSDKYVEIFCVDHNQPCCTICATVKHRKCDKVIEIGEALSGIKQSSKTTELSSKLKYFNTQLDKSIEVSKENVNRIESESSSTILDIKNLKDKIVSHLTELSNKVIKDVETTKKGEVTQLHDRITELSSLRAKVVHMQNIFQACLKHGSDLQCFNDVNRIATKSEELSRCIKPFTKETVIRLISLKVNDALNDFEKNVKYFGDVNAYSTSMHQGNVRVLFIIDVGESINSSSSGVFIGNLTVLTIRHAFQLRTFNENGTKQREIVLPKKPYDICKISNDICAVSTYKDGEIYFVNVSHMNIDRTLKTTASIGGICYLGDLFLTSLNNELVWIDASTGEIKSEKHTKGHSVFPFSEKKDTYIYSDGKNSVRSVFNETEVYHYTNEKLTSPRGIDVDFEGNVYICGFTSNNIHQLTSDGQLIRIISSADLGVLKPWIIRFKENSNRFLLTSLDSGKVVICEIC